jgi:hypothetical protein
VGLGAGASCKAIHTHHASGKSGTGHLDFIHLQSQSIAHKETSRTGNLPMDLRPRYMIAHIESQIDMSCDCDLISTSLREYEDIKAGRPVVFVQCRARKETSLGHLVEHDV